MVETFLELDEDGELSATYSDQMDYTTPKPVKKKGKLAKSNNGSLQDESEISNSQIESEDGNSPVLSLPSGSPCIFANLTIYSSIGYYKRYNYGRLMRVRHELP